MRFALKLASSRPDRWLVWLIVASLVLPPAYFALVAYQSRTATRVAADQQMAGTVRLLREHAQKVFDTDELVIQQVDRLIAGLSWDEIARSETLHQQLKRLDDQLAQIRGIYLVAPDGTMATSSRVFPVPPIDLSDRDYFTALRDGYLGAFISKIYRGRSTGIDQFNFARRRSSTNGTFNGVIDISDSPRYFEEAFGETGNDAASVVLARADGEELAYHPTPMLSGLRAPTALIMNAPQNDPIFANSMGQPHDGTARLSVYQRLHGYPLFVGYSVPISSVYASWRRTVVQNGILVGVGSLTIAFMGWLVLRGFRSERAEVERRRQAELKMEQAKRMEVIGQLTSGVAQFAGDHIGQHRTITHQCGRRRGKNRVCSRSDGAWRRPHPQDAGICSSSHTRTRDCGHERLTNGICANARLSAAQEHRRGLQPVVGGGDLPDRSRRVRLRDPEHCHEFWSCHAKGWASGDQDRCCVDRRRPK
jgi:two-component system NtrC family sensor kinase